VFAIKETLLRNDIVFPVKYELNSKTVYRCSSGF
jgi:hypothetical protein